MDFEERLQRAIQRGQRRNESNAAEERAKALSEDDFKRLHSQIRLELSEYIEQCLKRLAAHFPGFQVETLYGDRGWGAACSRDDLRMTSGRRNNEFSRFELAVRPFSQYHVVDLQAKGTVRNKELLIRRHYEDIVQTDAARFKELIDTWVVEYAELYAAGSS